MRMASSLTNGTSPSTPLNVVLRPSFAARFNPSESGSTPTTQAGSIHSLRSAFMTRSVPMFPEPTIAALIRIASFSKDSDKAHSRRADAADEDAHRVARFYRFEGDERSAQDHLAGLEGRAEAAERIGQ